MVWNGQVRKTLGISFYRSHQFTIFQRVADVGGAANGESRSTLAQTHKKNVASNKNGKNVFIVLFALVFVSAVSIPFFQLARIRS